MSVILAPYVVIKLPEGGFSFFLHYKFQNCGVKMASLTHEVFSPDDSGKVKGVLDSVLGGQTYNHAKTSPWAEAIADGVLAALPLDGYKLVVDVLIMEKGKSPRKKKKGS